MHNQKHLQQKAELQNDVLEVWWTTGSSSNPTANSILPSGKLHNLKQLQKKVHVFAPESPVCSTCNKMLQHNAKRKEKPTSALDRLQLDAVP